MFVGILNFSIYSNTSVKLSNFSILIIGDSHSQTSLNPDLFLDAKNIAQSKEPYALTFWKLKHILQSNKIDTLLIGFSHHNISSFNDYKFSDKKWSNQLFKRCYVIEDFHSIKQKIHVDYFDFYKIMIQQTCIYPKVNHFNFIGSYRSHDRSNISDSIESSSRHYMRNNQELGVSEISISYLDSIISLCNHNSITPIIIVSPVHKSYYKRIPKEISIRFETILNDLDAEGVIVIDKSNSIYYDNEFYNSDHLNTKGSFRFSKEIKDILHTF
jgi:hypothetical protein